MSQNGGALNRSYVVGAGLRSLAAYVGADEPIKLLVIQVTAKGEPLMYSAD